MIDGSEKRNRQFASELQNSRVCEKRSKKYKRNILFKLAFAKTCFVFSFVPRLLTVS